MAVLCFACLGLIVATLLSMAPGADAKSLKPGSYVGKIRPTDVSDKKSDTDIKFKVDGSGRKIKKLVSIFYYTCFVGGSFTLQYYAFPAVHKGPIKIKKNGRFSAKDVIDKKIGFVVKFAGKTKGSSRAKGTIVLDTASTGGGCGRDYTWSVKRK